MERAAAVLQEARSFMLTIKISATGSAWPLVRQTPGSRGVWGDCRFVVDQEIAVCDYWVVYEGLSRAESVCCPRENVILVTGEPPSVKHFDSRFQKQFATVITCQGTIQHPNVIRMQQALPCHVGRRAGRDVDIGFSKDYDEFKAMKKFKKERLMSVICSDKTFTKGHRKRLDFVRRMTEHFRSRIDVFGRGIREIEDKWDAIAP